jgi:hypothetical protein
MFTWICPQCGKEVPPAYTDCPNCAEKAAQAGKPEQPAASVPVSQAAPPQYAPQSAPPQAPPPQPYAYMPQKRSLPTWLLTIFVAGGTAAVIFGAIWLFSSKTETKPSVAVESPAAKPGAPTNPIQRNIEVSGVRFVPDSRHKGKTLVKFVVINHSGMDLSGLAGNVTMWGATRKSDEDAQGSFAFTTDLHPFESKELEALLNTKFKIYELPDWQNITPDVQITAPVVTGGSAGR